MTMDDYGFLLAVHHLKFRKQNARRMLERIVLFQELKMWCKKWGQFDMPPGKTRAGKI